MTKVFRNITPLLLLMLLIGISSAPGQQEVKWMSAGSLHNWFSSLGCEIEVGRSSSADQQDGLQWPAWYAYQDCQAAKGFWIGATNWTDQTAKKWDYKVVHIGPRVRGTGEFIPVKFEMVSKFEPPEVTVDGSPSTGKTVENDRVDPTMKPDRVINNVVATAIGVTMTRTVMQFSNQYHDNYMIFDYVFKNTGDVNGDGVSDLPNQTLTGLYFYWQYRYSACADTRYVIANSTSWGINAMNDARGDGFVLPTTNATDTDDSVNIPGVYSSPHMRAQFVWHGKLPSFTQYDNLFAPIFVPYYTVDAPDTAGRIGSPQFVGHVTIHADKSPTDTTDDFSQPSTTSFVGSDETNTSNNDQFNIQRMTNEYTAWMSIGHKSPPTQQSPGGYKYMRHSWNVESGGIFDVPTGDPALTTPGGFSNADGYGPYTLGPGQSIHIVIAEGVAGLSRDKCIELGKWYKKNYTASGAAKAKNDTAFTGKDSLFQTFRRAIANYMTGFSAPAAPDPPSSFSVSSGDPINLTWDVANPSDPNLKGFRIYRAVGDFYQPFIPLATLPPTARSYDDNTAVRGNACFYYISSIGDPALNTGAALTPKDTLFSNRIYTQTYTPAYLQPKRPAGTKLSDIRIVPNPYVISSDPAKLRFPGEPDKIAFFNIPARCKISIYTELGELIDEIQHTSGSGDEYWNSITSSRQVIVSGIYIVVFEDLDSGQRAIQKLSVIR